MIKYCRDDVKLKALSECGVLSDSDINEIFFRSQWRRIAKQLKYNQLKDVVREAVIDEDDIVYGHNVLKSIKTNVLNEMNIDRDIMIYDCFACYQVYSHFKNCFDCCVDWGQNNNGKRLCVSKNTLYRKMIKLCHKYGDKVRKGRNPFFLRRRMAKIALKISNLKWYDNVDIVEWRDI